MSVGHSGESAEPSRPVLQFHGVLLYDLVGQSSKLRRITSIPETDDEKQTAGAVVRMRRYLRQYYEKVSKSQIDRDFLSPEACAVFDKTRPVNLTIRNFSDLTVAHTPLGEVPNAPSPLASLSGLVGAASAMMLVSLAAGAPVRGAIDVGLAVDLEGREIYGPILDKVYTDESQIADWPRILAGKELTGYLDAAAQDPCAEPHAAIGRRFAKMAREFIVTDVDGLQIIDYLGVAANARMGAEGAFAFVEKACAFVQTEYNRFREEGPAKLAARFERVLVYCEARKATWK